VKSHPVCSLLVAIAVMPVACVNAQAAPAPSNTVAGTPPATIIYSNAQYGFCFVLPEDWKGYTVVTEKWSGENFSSGQTVHGPQLLLRNPKWTAQQPYQDIPIMVFTPAEWQQVVAVTMSVSAAPIGPEELGQNTKYVFALPPRWIGFDDALGQDEVNAWMVQNRLQAPCGKSSAGTAK